MKNISSSIKYGTVVAAFALSACGTDPGGTTTSMDSDFLLGVNLESSPSPDVFCSEFGTILDLYDIVDTKLEAETSDIDPVFAEFVEAFNTMVVASPEDIRDAALAHRGEMLVSLDYYLKSGGDEDFDLTEELVGEVNEVLSHFNFDVLEYRPDGSVEYSGANIEDPDFDYSDLNIAEMKVYSHFYNNCYYDEVGNAWMFSVDDEPVEDFWPSSECESDKLTLEVMVGAYEAEFGETPATVDQINEWLGDDWSGDPSLSILSDGTVTGC